MSYKAPIEEGQYFLAWKSGGHVVIEITEYEQDAELLGEFIRGKAINHPNEEILSRVRLIELLSKEDHPEYYL